MHLKNSQNLLIEIDLFLILSNLSFYQIYHFLFLYILSLLYDVFSTMTRAIFISKVYLDDKLIKKT